MAMPVSFFKIQAVAGHAETPDASANHPLVKGQGPFVRSSHKPPPPATAAQPQPTIRPNVAIDALRFGEPTLLVRSLFINRSSSFAFG